MKLNKKLAAIAGSLAMSACASGPNPNFRSDMHALMALSDFNQVAEKIQDSKKSQYQDETEAGGVLYNLDLGAALHDSKKYKESDQCLDLAEQRMEALYTKSIAEAVGQVIASDNVAEYEGEPYERALLHVYRALNHLYQNEKDEAAVEARKVSSYLTELSEKRGLKLNYRDDAFAHYITALVLAENGDEDNARISSEKAKAIYGANAEKFETPLPAGVDNINIPNGKGEVVIVHYNGISPTKTENVISLTGPELLLLLTQNVVPLSEEMTKTLSWIVAENGVELASQVQPELGEALQTFMTDLRQKGIRIAFPTMTPSIYGIHSSRVQVDGANAGDTSLVENIGQIATLSLNDRIEESKTRTIVRSFLKFTAIELAKMAAKIVAQKKAPAGGLGFASKVAEDTGVAGEVLAAITERADIRGWFTIPAELRLARIPLAPGKHSIVIDYLDANGKVVTSEERKDIEVKAGERTWIPARTAF